MSKLVDVLYDISNPTPIPYTESYCPHCGLDLFYYGLNRAIINRQYGHDDPLTIRHECDYCGGKWDAVYELKQIIKEVKDENI